MNAWRMIRSALLDWRFGALVIAAAAVAVYWPAMNRVFAADQLWYFAEVDGDPSLSAGLRHIDYAISRTYWRGDDLLFRPVLFIWLAIANRLFSYHHVWWNMASLALHVGVAVALLRLFLAIRPSFFALPAAVTFAVLEPPMELVVWSHLGGYLLACLFLVWGLIAFVALMEGPVDWRRSIAYAVPFSLGGLTYEALVPIAAAGAVIVVVTRTRARGSTDPERGSLSAGRIAVLFCPVLVFSVLYVFHALQAPRLSYVGRADNEMLFEIANVGRVVNGMGRMLAAWTRELALPTALHLWMAPFERFNKTFEPAWSQPALLVNASLAVLGAALTALAGSRRRMSEAGPLHVLLLSATVAYTAIIAFGRSTDEVAAITYYSYLYAVLLFVLAYSLVDFNRLTGRKGLLAAVLLCAFAVVHARGTSATAREVQRVNRYPSLYLTRVIAFVDQHRAESEFSFMIEPHPESVDPAVLLATGYPHDPGAVRSHRRMTEILFAPYYDDGDPKYVLGASAEQFRARR